MNHDVQAYGLWSLVVINSAIFILFAFSFFKPASRRQEGSMAGIRRSAGERQ